MHGKSGGCVDCRIKTKAKGTTGAARHLPSAGAAGKGRGAWMMASGAVLLPMAAACAAGKAAGAGCGRAARGHSHCHKVTIHAIDHHMLALIRWPAAPGQGRRQLGGFRISVSICQPAVRRVGHRRHRACNLRARRPLASTGLRPSKGCVDETPEKSTTYIANAQVKRIIGAKPPSDRSVPASPVAARLVQVDGASAGQRLDNFLLRQLKGVPKTHVYRIIRSGQVRINKGRAHADTRVQAGDMVRLPPLRISDTVAQKAEHPAPAREFPILWEDEHLIAIDKPAGVAVHGGSGVSFGVIEQLRQARPDAPFLELVHRLDRETSGILLVAKKRSALTHLQAQLRARTTGKTYLALVAGARPAHQKGLDPPPPQHPPHHHHTPHPPTTPDAPPGLPSIPLVGPRGSWPARAGLPALQLLEVTIKTGRTHQIRVHLASQGHAIAGDDKYGDFELNKRLQKQGLKRMFLHAWRLQFKHPASGEPVALHAELAPELADLVNPP